MSGWEIYLITRCDAAQVFFIVISALFAATTFLVTAFVLIEAVIEVTNTAHVLRKSIKWMLTISVISGLLAVVTPTTKEMAAIVILPKILNNQQVQTEANEIYSLAKQWLLQQVSKEIVNEQKN